MKNNYFKLVKVEDTIELIFDYEITTSDLLQSVRIMTDLIFHDGIIAIDFSDISSLLLTKKTAFVITKFAKGENRIYEAMMNPLLKEINLANVSGFFVSISAFDITMNEFEEVRKFIDTLSLDNPMIRIGLSIDENLGDEVKITMVII